MNYWRWILDIFEFNKALKMAVFDELSRDFAFGCVNLKSQGSHPDMTSDDFILSIDTITKAFEETNWDEISDFTSLRKRGLEVEKAMFSATKGKNTYKGLVFLSIILALAFIKTDKLDQMPKFIKNFSRPLISDYKKSTRANYYKNLGLRDVRTLPLTGFEEIFDLSLALDKNKMDDLLLTLYLIGNFDDTTTLNRSSLADLRYVQNYAKKIYKDFQNGNDIKKEVQNLNEFYLEKQITSGGVADIFTITKTLYYLRRIYE